MPDTPALPSHMPIAFDAALGAEARAAVPYLPDAWRAVLEGVGGTSPYLKSLITKEATWLPDAVQAPDRAFSEILAQTRDLPPDTAKTALRRAKRRVALLAALMDLTQLWPLERVTGALTDFADAATQAALNAALLPMLRRGKVPGMSETPEHYAQRGAGLVALAMGKMGAEELNYSSDIDLICLLDETQFAPGDFVEARAALVKTTRQMCAILSDNTADGYVFRTDLRLRPDPSVTPIVVAMEAAERYYESLGRSWERAAFIKARPAAGDVAAGVRFLKDLKPFVWRRHLDYAAIEDAHAMRLAIRAQKGRGKKITLPGHDMKLGRGGIREIEFFTQTQQLISGGRDPRLRVRGTVEGLARLAEAGWVPEALAQDLTEHYRFHRTVEHRLQMMHDAQTHALPQTQDGFARLAALMGRPQAALEDEIAARLQAVHDEIERFFAPDARRDGTSPTPQPPEGFGDATTARWPSYPALRSARAAEIFGRIRPDILQRLSETTHPDQALHAFDRFLSGLPAGVQVFSLFEANPQLIDLIVDIAGTAPALAAYLARNASVFDAVIGGGFWTPWPGADVLRDALSERMAQEDDYETKLDTARRWAKEWHFRIGVHHLRGLSDAATTGRTYADLADACVEAIWPEVVAQFARKYGPPPGRGAVVLAMGSLGAQRLTATSDLDLIVIYDPQGTEQSDGPRVLQTRPYYARLTQSLVTALSAPMAEGRLYEVDMRLRPSGTQGPVATSWASFEAYQREGAWVWEHLALTRARVVTGDATLRDDVEALRQELLVARSASEVMGEVASMRARIAAAKSPAGVFDAKIGPGRMQDIELYGQALALINGDLRRDTFAHLHHAPDAQILRDAYRHQAQLQMAMRLLGTDDVDMEAVSGGSLAVILRSSDKSTLQDLAEELRMLRDKADTAITQHLEEGTHA